jgi:hypothetical protein
MQIVKLSLEAPRVEGSMLIVAAIVEHPDGSRHRLWWQLPAQWRDAVTAWADPFVVAFVFLMMQWRRDVMVEGVVSPSLLLNLEQYMAIWGAWIPDRYGPVEIHAREEVEAPPPRERGQTIMPFSCGADSSFTLYRHHRGLVGRRTRHVAAAMVMHGFDIRLDQANAEGMYEGLLTGARAMAESVGVPCIPAASNFQELPTYRGHSFGTHLVSGLRLLAGRFDATLLPNDVAYPLMAVPWGSHPVSNPFLGSLHFPVIDDGGEAARCEKARLLAQWPEAMRHLRVCFENPGSHVNCCRCEKCLRTILSFRAVGAGLPPAFARDITNQQIHRLRFHYEHNARQWLEIVRGAQRTGLGESDWVRAIHAVIRRNRRRETWRRFKQPFVPLRDALRLLLRGSSLSRRKLAAQRSENER